MAGDDIYVETHVPRRSCASRQNEGNLKAVYCIWANERECPTVDITIYTIRVKTTSGDEVEDQEETKEKEVR